MEDKIGTQKFLNEYPGKALSELPELAACLCEISCDPMTWTTIYRCKYSGEYWEEVYESKGHGEIPIVRRKI